MRSHRGWKALVGLATAASLMLATAPEGSAAGKLESVIDSNVGEIALNGPASDEGVQPSGPTYFPRANYVWPYASGPFYGKVSGREEKGPGVVITGVGSFRLDGGVLPFPRELETANKLDREAYQYFLVQVHPATVSKERWDLLYSKIRANGGEVIRHLPVAVMLARLTPRAHAALSEARDLLAIEPYHPAFKLDPAIGRTPLLDPGKAMSDVYTLDISLHRGENARDAAARIGAMGGTVHNVWSDRIQADLPSAQLRELAGLESVYRVHEKTPVVPWDQQITNAVQTGGIRFNSNPFHDAGIRGAGQVLMVLDNGIQLDAGDLSDTSSSAGTAGLGHRKVRFYGTTTPFGGSGDDRGCDAPEQGGFTHGHLVAAIALGNAEHVDLTFRTLDVNGNPWELTGVAPDAKLAAYDAHVTPAVGGCQNPLFQALDVGALYDPAPGVEGSLDHAYLFEGARTFNFSWGSGYNNSYTADADDVDEFLNDNKDAMVFIAAGNLGSDFFWPSGTPDLGTLTEPGTAKNSVSIGAHGGADDFANPNNINERAFFSGTGPAAIGWWLEGETGRFAPLLMAPGQERGTTGKAIAFSCRTHTNDSAGAVVCDSVSAKAGTSFAAAAAAGAALLVRDYFAQGFHPDGTSGNAGNAGDVVPNVSGALVKSVLIASAEMLGVGFTGTLGQGGPADNLTLRYRANNEQGYGRIQLDKALPLQNWSPTPTGLLVVDGGIPGGVNDLSGGGLTGSIDATTQTTQTATFELCDDSQELRAALSWVEAPGDALLNDLDLEIIAPDGTLYFGNYFTDDDNRDGVVDPLTENCPTRFNDGTPQDRGLDHSEWSLATCVRPGAGGGPSLPPRDSLNPTEAIYLSPNPEGTLDEDGQPELRGGRCDDAMADACGHDAHCNGVACLGGVSQVQAGTWTVNVKTKGGDPNAAQGYALVIAGGVCTGSSAAFDQASYVCNDDATIAINERSEGSDPAGGLSVAVVAARTLVEVLDGSGAVVDSESGTDLGFELQDPDSLRFVAENLLITDSTARDPGNGVLDVQNGDTLRVTYADESVGGVGGDPNKVRVATAKVGCQVQLLSGASRFAQFGLNTSFLVVGGCERNARGFFEFGFPDRYMDAGESIAYRVAFTSIESDPLENAVLQLTCVFADADSPASCKPGSTDCPDPNRENNPACTDLSILDPYQVVGQINAGAAISTNFSIRMNTIISGTPDVEMVLRVTGENSGKTASAVIVNPHRLNVDEATVRYNTDFPNGGTLTWDRDNNGLIENPTSTGITGFPTSHNTDYRFETVVYSDLTLGTDADGNPVVVNDGIQAPWNFDNNDGGFTTGLAAGTDDGLIAETIAQWGEDKNFNNQLDGRCQSGPSAACNHFPTDPVLCGYCNPASSNPAAACTIDANCPGGACDFTCLNLEDRDPENFPVAMLDQNWSTRGGCGWQTKAPGTCSGDTTIGCYNDGDCGAAGTCTGPAQAAGGIWHTGRVGTTVAAACGVMGDAAGQCQLYETIGGLTGQFTWFELLVTPELTKVNQAQDAAGNPLATAEIGEFRFNWAVDMPDNHVSTTVEFDNDTESLEPVDLKSDFTVLITSTGPYGARNGRGNPFLTRGWGLFAPINPGTGLSENGTVGNNRVGKNSCFFEGVGTIPRSNLPRSFVGLPPDDDVNEGYCPSGSGTTGHDPHVNYCTTVCSANTEIACGSDPDCTGTCFGSGLTAFCGNAPSIHCTADADCNIGTCVDVACNGTCNSGSCSNGKPGVCASHSDCAEACVFTTAAIDEFVQPNGPVRGFDLNDYNGPDMRFTTLEDTAGPTGNKFAGAIGFVNRQANSQPKAVSGYGVGVDDVVVEWREFTLEEDTTDCDTTCVGGAGAGDPCSSDADCGAGVCGGGSCATVNLITNNIYEGNTTVGITVVDLSPSGNDCDFNGVTDTPLDFDCDNNRVPDVVVKVDSPQEVAGEFVILNAVGSSSTTFKGQIPISSSYDVPGTLFVATQGNLNPTIRVTYQDEDDGTGRPCQNSVDPDAWGQVQALSTIFLTPAQLVVTRSTISDNGDDDGWADQGETIDLAVEVSNKGAFDATGVTLRLTSNDPNVACITKPTIAFGDLARRETKFSSDTFRFIISPTASRTDPFQDLTATLNVSIDANEFQSLRIPQQLVIDLDLDATGGGPPTQFFEGFEGGFGAFTTMHIDADLNSPDSDINNRAAGTLNADDHRCQYSDPDWEGSASHGNSQGQECYPGVRGAFDTFYYHIVTDRAFSGVQSMAYNIFMDAALGYTHPWSQLEAIRTIEPINLGYGKVCSIARTASCTTDGDCAGGETCDFAQPVVSLKHQASLLDHRSLNTQAGRGVERAIISVQLADHDGVPQGVWSRVSPFVNIYDTQANSNFFSCTFDPADDGNTEEDFFDPTDPIRSQGPSSTCSPNFNFAHQGDTDAPFDPTALGDASDGPGLSGATGIGTWVEPIVDLARFRGRRVRIRFLTTGMKLGATATVEQAYRYNPNPGDDGWFIDDVTVIDAITDPPATITADTKDNGDLPTCADQACSVVVADVAVTPSSGQTRAPGQVVELDAGASTVDVCLSGVPQYKFWVEVNGNTSFDSGTDVLLRDWTDNETLSDTPAGPTDYGVAVRCATDTDCGDTQIVSVDVDCPSSGSLTTVDSSTTFLHRAPLNRRSILLDGALAGGGKDAEIFWSTGVTVDAVSGSLTSLRSSGFGGEVCLTDNYSGTPTSLVDTTAVPNSGDGRWYLMRSAAACNEPGAGGSYGGIGEASTPTRDAIAACGD